MFRFVLALTVLSLALVGPQSAGVTTVPTTAAFADDADDDNDGVADVAEQNCGGNATNPNIRPERIDDSFTGKDDDGDTVVDEALPGGASGFDCDGDGYKGSAEDHVFSPAARGDQDACGIDALAGGPGRHRAQHQQNHDPGHRFVHQSHPIRQYGRGDSRGRCPMGRSPRDYVRDLRHQRS